MAVQQETLETPVLAEHHAGILELVLNRPGALNTLNQAMIRLLQQGVNTARAEADCRVVLLRSAGKRGFCAGGDLKAMVELVREKAWDRASSFFQEESNPDLDLHRFSKPVVALAEGITMGGGMGLVAGADLVVVTEDSRLAMPETLIGFFPDVGATGWLFNKCPPGYPEYLALTGKEVEGAEAVRLGLATHLAPAEKLPALLEAIRASAARLPASKEEALGRLRETLAPWCAASIIPKPELDAWVARHFAGKMSVSEILDSLAACEENCRLDEEIWDRLQGRSPTALVLTLKLLRHNENRPLPEVLAAEARAARFMIAHHDYQEGIRARLLDKDQQPRWQSASLEEVQLALDF